MTDFNRLPPADPLEDVFAEGPLRFVESATAGFTAYSVGPDGDDDRGSLHYSPTNGTKSDGDLLLNIPPQREYPFRTEGFAQVQAEELLGEFRNGLPVDLFRQDRPMSIRDATAGIPLKVFGFGPTGTVGNRLSNVRMYSIPGMVLLNEGETEPVDTSAGQPGVQFVFDSRTKADLPPFEREQAKRFEALPPQEREVARIMKHPLYYGGYGYGYGGPGSEDSVKRSEIQRQGLSEIQAEMEKAGKMDLSLYPPMGEVAKPLRLVPYDPTNGVKSDGQIFLPHSN